MTRLKLALSIALLGLAALAFIQFTMGAESDIVWSIQDGGANADNSRGIAINDRNTVVAASGYFFHPSLLSPAVCPTQGGYDVWAALYDTDDGSVIDTYCAGGSGFDWAYDISVFEAPNGTDWFAVTGFFNGTVDFGIDAPCVSNGSSDLFMVFFGPDSLTPVWRWCGGSTGEDQGYRTVIAEERIYWTGFARQDIDFGCGLNIVQDPGDKHVFTVAFDHDGNCVWDDVRPGSGWGVDVDDSTIVVSTEASACSVLSFDLSGNLLWQHADIGSGSCTLYGIDLFGDHVYVSGQAVGEFNFGLGPQQFQFVGAVLLSLDATTGATEWQHTLDTSELDAFQDVSAIPGSVAVAGSIGDPVNGKFDLVVEAFDPNGIMLWQRIWADNDLGDPTGDNIGGWGIEYSPSGHLYFVGNVTESIFGPLIGGSDGPVVKLCGSGCGGGGNPPPPPIFH